jgi:hypothetical protein
MKKEMVDEHLMHIIKSTTPFQRMVWLKKSIDFWKMVETKRLTKRVKPVRQSLIDKSCLNSRG